MNRKKKKKKDGIPLWALLIIISAISSWVEAILFLNFEAIARFVFLLANIIGGALIVLEIASETNLFKKHKLSRNYFLLLPTAYLVSLFGAILSLIEFIEYSRKNAFSLWYKSFFIFNDILFISVFISLTAFYIIRESKKPDF